MPAPSAPTPAPVTIPYSGNEAVSTLNSQDLNQGKAAPLVIPVDGAFSLPLTAQNPLYVATAGTRLYPSNAAHNNTTVTLVGAGSISDVFTFTLTAPQQIKQVIIQNNTAADVYIACGSGTTVAATPGDVDLVGNQHAILELAEVCTWVAVYGAAAVKVNQNVAGGLIIYALT